MNNYRIKSGGLFEYEINCGVYQKTISGVRIIVENVPELQIGANIKDGNVIFTDLGTGTRLLSTDRRGNYLQELINILDDVLSALPSKRFSIQRKRLSLLPTKEEYQHKTDELCMLMKIRQEEIFFKDRIIIGYIYRIYKNRLADTNKSINEAIAEDYGQNVVELIKWFHNLLKYSVNPQDFTSLELLSIFSI